MGIPKRIYIVTRGLRVVKSFVRRPLLQSTCTSINIKQSVTIVFCFRSAGEFSAQRTLCFLVVSSMTNCIRFPHIYLKSEASEETNVYKYFKHVLLFATDAGFGKSGGKTVRVGPGGRRSS